METTTQTQMSSPMSSLRPPKSSLKSSSGTSTVEDAEDENNLYTVEYEPPQKSEIAVQTDIHLIPQKKDAKYQWNEWELRKQAIKTVDLKSKQTHSTQTTDSNFRRENATQHYGQKTNTTQTGINTSSNVPLKKQHITGIHGDNSQLKVVNITMDF